MDQNTSVSSGTPNSSALLQPGPSPALSHVHSARATARTDLLFFGRVLLGLTLILAFGNWPIFWEQISFLLGLAILTYPVRSVRWGTLYNFFLIGIAVGYVTVGVHHALMAFVPNLDRAVVGNAIVVPILEESFKVAALAVILLSARWRFRIALSACDAMLVAAALGSGFGFLENVFHGHVYRGERTGPTFLGHLIFPDSTAGFIGHGASAALIGLAMGWLMYAWRWRRLAGPGVIAVLLAAVWMMVDHGMLNYRVVSRDVFFLARWISAIDGEGAWTPYLFLGMIVLTIAFDRLRLSRAFRHFPRLGTRASVRYVAAPLNDGLGYPEFREAILRLVGLTRYTRLYRQVAFLAWRLPGDGPERQEDIASALVIKIREATNGHRSIANASVHALAAAD